jgi:hypothetical protein
MMMHNAEYDFEYNPGDAGDKLMYESPSNADSSLASIFRIFLLPLQHETIIYVYIIVSIMPITSSVIEVKSKRPIAPKGGQCNYRFCHSNRYLHIHNLLRSSIRHFIY